MTLVGARILKNIIVKSSFVKKRLIKYINEFSVRWKV